MDANSEHLCYNQSKMSRKKRSTPVYIPIGPWLVMRAFWVMPALLVGGLLWLVNSSVYQVAAQAEPATAAAPAAPAEDATAEDSAPADCRLGGGFPENVRRWCDLITRYAEQHELPPDLVAALIWIESGGNPSAFSRSGAVGLMQVMPRDGPAAKFVCINGPCFANRPSRAELEDPEFNIAYGTRMLAGLYGRSQSLREALRSYGPMDMGYRYADMVLSLYQRHKP